MIMLVQMITQVMMQVMMHATMLVQVMVDSGVYDKKTYNSLTWNNLK